MKATGLVFKSRDYIGSAEPPATVLDDESRFRNDGTFKGSGEPDWVQLPSGLWVMDFDGSDDIVTISAHSSINNLPVFAIVVWINPTTSGEGSAGRIVAKATGSGVDEGWFFAIVSDILSLNMDYAGDKFRRQSTTTVDYDDWQQVAVVWNGAIATDCKLYKNGSEVSYDAGQNRDGTGARDNDDAVDLTIGSNIDADRAFEGKIALPRIYNYALSAEQIAAIFQAERHWFGV